LPCRKACMSAHTASIEVGKASAGLWAKWLIALPTSMLAVWALVQAFLHGK